jgi:thymidylate synthase (FAD)
MSVKLVSVTQPKIEGVDTAEDLVVYCARVSNPQSQEAGENPERLLRYMVRHEHWSPFEMVELCMEIEAPRDISRQILRHWSFRFQEFSQRYAVVQDMRPRECRLQDQANRQNSIECADNSSVAGWWRQIQSIVASESRAVYDDALHRGIAKEVARAVLPEGLTMSRLYMHGSLRSWLFYCRLRMGQETQKEHKLIATQCWEIVREQFPTVAAAFEEGA